MGEGAQGERSDGKGGGGDGWEVGGGCRIVILREECIIYRHTLENYETEEVLIRRDSKGPVTPRFPPTPAHIINPAQKSTHSQASAHPQHPHPHPHAPTPPKANPSGWVNGQRRGPKPRQRKEARPPTKPRPIRPPSLTP